VARIQVKDAFTECEGNVAVGTDGTSKFGYHFGNVELNFPDGHRLVAALRDVLTNIKTTTF
jgi:hypothetical protein